MSMSLSSCRPKKADCSLCTSDKELSFIAGSFTDITDIDSTMGSQAKAEHVLASHPEKPYGNHE